MEDSIHLTSPYYHDLSSPSSSSIQYHLFPIISSSKVANDIIFHILQSAPTVIGVDIEAAVEMSRFGILCLLQVKTFFYIIFLYKKIAHNNKAYIFDMTQMDSKELKLQEVF